MKSIWKKRCLSVVVSLAMAVTVLPAAPAIAVNAEDGARTVKVELRAGEKYTDTYTYTGSEEAKGITTQPDSKIATVTRTGGEEQEVKGVQLFSHKANAATVEAAFAAEADEDRYLEDCEFTFTKAEGENLYTIYNECKEKYLNTGALASYFKSEACNMTVEKVGDTPAFRLSLPGAVRGGAFLYFHTPQMNFNRMGDYQENRAAGYGMTLLEKQESVREDDVIPGYRTADSVVSGRKYLISYAVDDKVIVLYPENGTSPQTKLVGKSYTGNKTTPVTVTITAGEEEGTTTAVVDGVVYQITRLGVPTENLNLVPGESYFLPGAKEAVSADASVAKAEKVSEKVSGLYDYTTIADRSLENAYAKTANAKIDMAQAEVQITKEGENYLIYSPSRDGYLVNTAVADFYEKNPIPQKLNPVKNSDGTTSFQIVRVSDSANGRSVCFYYPKSAFDANGSVNQNADCDHSLEFLEKHDGVTNLDPIPGYERASEIVSGKTYLITQFYQTDAEEGIVVLYPSAGMNKSKLYKPTDTEGVRITAVKPNGTTTVTVDGVNYVVRIAAACDHTKGVRTEGKKPAACEEDGNTGTKICSICGEKIEDGKKIDKLGHKWDDGKVTTPVTTTTDGEKTYTCQNNPSHTRTETISSMDYAKEVLGQKIADAQAEVNKKDEYTESTWSDLNKALMAAVETAGSADSSQAAVNDAINALQAATGSLVTKELQSRIDQMDQLLNANVGDLEQYTDATRKAYEKAFEALKRLQNSKDVKKIDKAVENLEKAAANLRRKADEGKEAMVAMLDEQLPVVEQFLTSRDYSKESLEALRKAYDAAAAARNDDTKTTADLEKALADLNLAIENLKPYTGDPQPPMDNLPAVGSTFAYKNAVYKVTKSDKVHGTVTLVKPAKKTNKKFTVPATAVKDGISFQVTEIAKNAFKGNKKLASVVIGKNVKAIGANAFNGDGKLKKITVKATALTKVGKKAFKGINAKCKIKVPKKKKAAYQKLLKGKGQKASVKIS